MAEPNFPSDRGPVPDDLDDDFVEQLVAFDEVLREGSRTGTRAEARDIERDETACLMLLEQVYPRRTGAHGPIGKRIGRFELQRVLGEGGFGTVYLARDPLLGRMVAIKVPRLHVLASPELHARFLREASAVASLDHPNIVPVLEFGESGDVAYIISPYCSGSDLAGWVANHAPADPYVAAGLLAALADAVQYSHSCGIIHRDLKPSNVLLFPSTGSERGALPFVPKLTDFGLAKLMVSEAGLTQSRETLGTARYMAPEQFHDFSAGTLPETDVYGLGAILYELLAGKAPYRGETFLEVYEESRLAGPAAPSSHGREIPADLEAVCLKCLKTRPEDRYRTAAELAADLRRFLTDERTRARPETILTRFGRALGKRRWLAGLLAAGLLGLPPALRFVDREPSSKVAASRPEGSNSDARPADPVVAGRGETAALIRDIETAGSDQIRPILTALGSDREASLRMIETAHGASIGAGNEWFRFRLSIVALHLGDSKLAAELCRPREDPTPRQRWTETLVKWNGGVGETILNVQAFDEPGVRAATCLALGAMNPETLSKSEREAAASFLTTSYRESPDAGTHSAARWALRTWRLPSDLGDSVQPGPKQDWSLNSAGMTMLRVPAGRFRMGGRFDGGAVKSVDVVLTRDFLMSDCEVDGRQFREFIEDRGAPDSEKPAGWKWVPLDPNTINRWPVQMVSWNSAVLYCNWLSRREGLRPLYHQVDGQWTKHSDVGGYRLPTEAEWEYACRAGTTTAYSFGEEAVLGGAYGLRKRVGPSYCGIWRPNPWGFFDLHDNLAEWCDDWYASDLPGGNDPLVTQVSSKRVLRGSSYDRYMNSGSAARVGMPPETVNDSLGFRVVLIEDSTAE